MRNLNTMRNIHEPFQPFSPEKAHETCVHLNTGELKP
jgi:hypothetical protein